VFMLPLFFYKNTARGRNGVPTDYETLRAFICFSSDDTAISLIKWVGKDYRWVIGVMFSGLFGTSIGDTLYAVWAKTAFRMHAFRRLRDHLQTTNLSALEIDKELEKYKQVKFAKKYGDDLFEHIITKHLWLYTSESYVAPEVLTAQADLKPHYMQMWYKRTFNLNLKMSETRIFSHDLPWVTGVSTRFDVIRLEGPVYLKRRTVMRIEEEGPRKGQVIYYPYRQTRDYISKCCNTTNLISASSGAYWIAKWRGLMLDTCGTNTMAYEFLKYLHDFFMGEWRGVSDALKAELNYYKQYGSWQRTGSDMVPLLKKLEVHYQLDAVEMLLECPSQASILAKYELDEMYLNKRRSKYRAMREIKEPMVLMAAASSHSNGTYPFE